MDTIVDQEEGAYALRLNQIVQAQTGNGYWISGGDCSAGTSSSRIEVDVDAGSVSIDGTTVDFAAESVPLDNGSSAPRVDVVSVKSDGNFDATKGTPEAYAPTPGGADPAPFEHWSPAPNDGSGIVGVPLCYVLVEPGMTDSTALPADYVDDNIRVPGPQDSGFVKGDGTDNGKTTITVNDADFAVQDETDSPAKYIHRDHSAGTLTLGTPTATPVFEQPLDVSGTQTALDFGTAAGVKEIWSATGSEGDTFAARTAVSGAGNTAFNVRNKSAGNTLFTVPETGGADLKQSPLQGVTSITAIQGFEPFIDFRNRTDGTRTLWAIDDAEGSNPTEYSFSSNPGRPSGSVGKHLVYRNESASYNLFELQDDGILAVRDGGATPTRVATRTWAGGQFYAPGDLASGSLRTSQYIDIGQRGGDPTAPDTGTVRIYEDSGTIEAKWPDGTVGTLGVKGQ